MYSTATHQINYWIFPLIPPEEKRVLNADDVVNAGSKALLVSRQELLSKSRKHETVRARYICFRIMYFDLKMTLAAIGRVFGRDHTTVIHGLQSIENDLSIAAYRQEINEKIRAVKMLL